MASFETCNTIHQKVLSFPGNRKPVTGNLNSHEPYSLFLVELAEYEMVTGAELE
ncbi:hypothetical protein [Longitalea luteola]|uniref:hypothetical protein n=1 Tax=Longitalea luteola TaxID=2812563 RepID=UPI001A965063|nr:hypothetical protein [Longitalea luteola]